MKILLIVLSLAAAAVVAGCAEDTTDEFATFVHPDPSIARDISVQSVKCMHCPIYFQFEMNSTNVAMLLNYHEMQRVSEPTTHMEAVLRLPDAEWWPRGAKIERMDKYWIEYPTKDPTEAPMFRMALVEGETVYFMAKGGKLTERGTR